MKFLLIIAISMLFACEERGYTTTELEMFTHQTQVPKDVVILLMQPYEPACINSCIELVNYSKDLKTVHINATKWEALTSEEKEDTILEIKEKTE